MPDLSLDDLIAKFQSPPDLKAARKMRDTLDDPRIVHSLKLQFTKINDREAALKSLNKIYRFISETADGYENDAEFWGIAGGGVGVSMIAGGIVAMPAMAIPAIMVFPIASGGYTLFRSYLIRRELKEKHRIYTDIVEQLDDLRADLKRKVEGTQNV